MFAALARSLTDGESTICESSLNVRFLALCSPTVTLFQLVAIIIGTSHPDGIIVFHLDLERCCRFMPTGLVTGLQPMAVLRLLSERTCLGFVIYGTGVASVDLDK